jgi:hypothetical protein
MSGGAGIAAAYIQTATGAVLLTTPFVAATVASLCGAIVGLSGVWRILRRARSQP